MGTCAATPAAPRAAAGKLVRPPSSALPAQLALGERKSLTWDAAGPQGQEYSWAASRVHAGDHRPAHPRGDTAPGLSLRLGAGLGLAGQPQPGSLMTPERSRPWHVQLLEGPSEQPAVSPLPFGQLPPGMDSPRGREARACLLGTQKGAKRRAPRRHVSGGGGRDPCPRAASPDLSGPHRKYCQPRSHRLRLHLQNLPGFPSPPSERSSRSSSGVRPGWKLGRVSFGAA